MSFELADKLMRRFCRLRDHRSGLKGQAMAAPAHRSDCCCAPLLTLNGVVCCYDCRRPCQLSDLEAKPVSNRWDLMAIRPTRQIDRSSVDRMRARDTSQWLVLVPLLMQIPRHLSRQEWGFSLVSWECALLPQVERATRNETALVVAQIGRWAHPSVDWHPAEVRDAIHGARLEISARYRHATARQRLQVGI